MADKKHALSLLADPQLSTTGGQLAALQTATISQLALIRRLESESALRAVLVGLALHRIKASLPYGQFGPWLAQNVEAKRSQANNYMRLSTAFIAQARATKVELLAMPGDLALSSEEPGARKLLAKALSFVGECSLNELLVKYGIKGVTREGDEPANDGSPATEADGQLFFAEIAEHVLGIRTSVLNPQNIARLTPRQLDDLRAELANLNSEFTRLYDQARAGKTL